MQDLAAHALEGRAVLDELDHLPGLALGLDEADDVRKADFDLGCVYLRFLKLGKAAAVLQEVEEAHEDQGLQDAPGQGGHVDAHDVAPDALLHAGHVPDRDEDGDDEAEHDGDPQPVALQEKSDLGPEH